ncbi:META domain-containing protein [Muricauda oceani]|uniref:META domain-containing protein n=1 Tax=Flagellimonas oceani TaxID=2698672 RepID=A0A6G7J612_9FLAO|nr:META domain-containing protein [Allomuricauda oceani]MBW8242374.1 META domain-containing protein [Allomuricauda oceani]QII46130.1 META domain-containing protein [Allomuricauda oceani]
MKTSIILFFAVIVLAESCGGPKSSEEALYGTTWELEYISGPRIAFDGLFPEKKPQITFDKESGKVSGTDSCNGYSADYELAENTIVFGDPGPTTMMFCGGSERQFLEMMKKIDGYSVEDGKLNLLVGEVPMMRFKKVEP